jgi:indolepyruvate ferredoxin oxidoreductase beta subunit
MGAVEYPQGIIEELRSKVEDVQVIDAAAKAKEAGSERAMNIVLLGAAAAAINKQTGEKLAGINWDEIIEKAVKPQFAELNKKAFKIGY